MTDVRILELLEMLMTGDSVTGTLGAWIDQCLHLDVRTTEPRFELPETVRRALRPRPGTRHAYRRDGYLRLPDHRAAARVSATILLNEMPIRFCERIRDSAPLGSLFPQWGGCRETLTAGLVEGRDDTGDICIEMEAVIKFCGQRIAYVTERVYTYFACRWSPVPTGAHVPSQVGRE